MIAELLRRTTDEFDDQPDATPLDYVESWISAGQTMKDLADSLAKATKPDDTPADLWSVSGDMIRKYLEQSFGEAFVSETLTRARTRASYSMVDDAIAIAEEADEDAGSVARARLRVSARHWTAERFNPTAFGAKQAVSVSVSIGSLHLDALRQPAQKVTAALSTVCQALPSSTD